MPAALKTVADKGINWRGKTAVLRADLNAPIVVEGGTGFHAGQAARIMAVVPTIGHILDNGGGVTVLSHFGRPSREGEYDEKLSLRQAASHLESGLSREKPRGVEFCPYGEFKKAAAGEVAVLENTRFNVGERDNDSDLGRRYAELGDIFVMDAFASAHRAEASVVAVAKSGVPTCAGLLMESELRALGRIGESLRRPLVGVFGGAKISTKLGAIRRLATMCDKMIIGGGIANLLLLARGDNIGASLAERGMRKAAAELLRAAEDRLLLPRDVIAAPSAEAAEGRQIALAAGDAGDIAADERILDIGEKTREECAALLRQAGTIVWNGPPGLFERPPFAAGTKAVAEAVATSPAYALIGGGDTIAAAGQFGVLDSPKFAPAAARNNGHVSTGGGALLEYLAGEKLPGLEALGVG